MHTYLDAVGALDRQVTVAGDKVVAIIPAAKVVRTVPAELDSILDGVMVPDSAWSSLRSLRLSLTALQRAPLGG